MRQLAACLLVVLAGCRSDDRQPRDLKDPLQGFIGAVVADEPQAALIGRDILSIGGNAVDAAVAMYFAMAVTLPSQASLGGGGVCLAFEQKTGEVRVLDFLARAPASVPAGADRPSGVPGNPRGFYTLHARYGQLPWAQLLAPAERLARFGAQASRAFARDLEPVRAALATDPEIRRVFGTGDGRGLIGEGDTVRQLELAGVLARLRSEGPGSFYAGANAAEFVSAVRRAGGTLSVDDLYAYRPLWRDTLRLEVGNEIVHVPPPPLAGGLLAGQMLAMLGQGDRYQGTQPEGRGHLVIETAARAFVDRARWGAKGEVDSEDLRSLLADRHIRALAAGYRPERRDDAVYAGLSSTTQENPAAAGLLAVDRDGNAAACAVTLNSLFGTGRIAAGTGVIVASLPGPGGRGGASLGPVLAVNENIKSFHFAAVASGGVAAPTALAQVAARVLLKEEPLEQAVAAPRVHGGSERTRVYAEQALSPADIQALRRRGHPVALTTALGTVDAISCPEGLPRNPESCTAVADPRGNGLALTGG